ncbi:MAG: hypothetical protein ACE5GO_06140, partial [Anaerolineales bacterium]
PSRPISPGSPITAVRIGPSDDLAKRQADVRAEWERWGILEGGAPHRHKTPGAREPGLGFHPTPHHLTPIT